ncbi:N-methyl-L-tryptophan oxidase [Bradyrhizobium sp.]|uniref:N-methyl-L-tryptophan oxidase n=1 Tax=Bradyrhizobium sp. TaxID=376 RepID=UPI001EBEE865|nr:N-methyl-L-tryptophan oxidase [Bradyrhizobium sp.]MBV9984438.1 N-methyl-L-tryptophan oxidase [Bradyrhizobium sp.]
MKTCDIAIIGLGLMGSAALRELARRGADVLGFDPLAIGEARGSSHGSCRIFRRFNFESEAYTALSDRAFALWRALEAESHQTILMPSAILEAGPAGCPSVRKSRAAAVAAGGPITGPRTGREANAAYGAFNLPDDWDVVVHEAGGILLAERAMRALRAGVEHRVAREAAQIAPMPEGIRILTASGEVMARRVIVSAGPWIAGLVPGLTRHVKVTRQAVGWFAPARPETTRYGECPIFILKAARGMIYGFPDFEGRGVKAAQHDHGPAVGPDEWDPPVSDAELATTSAMLAELVPGAAGAITDREVCLYTNTAQADVVADDGGEFVIDRLPADPRIIVASPCSGHGAKFATAIGAMLADMALDPKVKAVAAFRLDRFSSFA